MVLGNLITVFSIFVWSASSEYQELSTCASPDGRNYKTNTTFTTADCLSHCVCTSEGQLGCVPLCPNIGLQCPIGHRHKEIMQHAGSEGSGCFCKRKICKPLNNNVAFPKTRYCFEGDNYYKLGEEFIRNCTTLCRCYSNGVSRCVPLCPYKKHCPFGGTDLQVPAQYSNGECMCKTTVCKSRTIAVMKDKCLINGRFYKAGEDFVSADCTGHCKCNAGGVVLCVSLCPPEGIKCPYNEKPIQLSRKVTNSNCTCPTWRCVKKKKDMQVFKKQAISDDRCTSESGNTYPIGQVFIDKNCTLMCHCRDDGNAACQPLCDYQDCAPFEKHHIIEVPILLPHGDNGRSNCSCPIKICDPIEDKCIVGEHTYNPGNEFISSDCYGYCKCYPGGSVVCASLCPPENIVCQYDEDKISSTREIPNSNCSCPTWSCLKRKHPDYFQNEMTGKDTCNVSNGNVYQIGQVFSDKNCTLRCHCEDYGKITCQPLCPDMDGMKLNCTPGNKTIMHVAIPLPDADGIRCSCPVNICDLNKDAKEIYNDKCIVGEHTYNPGNEFISSDCYGYCKCYPGGSVVCASLCPPENIVCQYDEDKISSTREIPNSNCSCPTWSCLKRKHPTGKDTCNASNGNVYQIGQVFSDKNCTLRCHCEDYGKITCQPLCPDMDGKKLNCTPGNKTIMHVAIPLPDADGIRCSCPVNICDLNEDAKEIYNDVCAVDERTFKSGDDFVSADCSGYCKCQPGGSILCVSLCPPEGLTCHYNEDAIQLSRKILNSNCTCPTWRCVKKKQIDVCTFDGVKHKIGEHFVDVNCTGYCKCTGTHAIGCVSLCPPHLVLCKPGETRVETVEPVLGSHCTCPTWKCLKDKCIVREHTYNIGDEFVSPDCSGYCKCQPGGGIQCVSLCPPEGLTCQHNEKAIQLSRKIPNSNCTCPTWKCLKKGQQDQCLVDGHVYKPGETFIPNDCSGDCTCLPKHGVVCAILCPQVDVICNPDEVIEQTLERIPNSNCSCPKMKCIKTKDDDVCTFEGVKHKIGQRFANVNCTGYCSCTGSNAVGCVSLCPPHYVVCKPGETKVETVQPILDGRCTCPTWKCLNDSGNWTRWSNWRSCDAPCGGGLRYRYRSCSTGKCIGSKTQTEVCNLAPCSPSYSVGPCGSIRLSDKLGGLWPRCDDDGFFEPLQCNPMTNRCWCADQWGNEEVGSGVFSQKPQCKSNFILDD